MPVYICMYIHIYVYVYDIKKNHFCEYFKNTKMRNSMLFSVIIGF